MNFQHNDLENGKWSKLSLIEQMANIGSEVIRAINWKNKENQEYSQMAFERALELFYFTVTDPKNKGHLKEIVRARECFIDYLVAKNSYNSTDESWQKYFHAFNYAARNSHPPYAASPC